MVVQPMLARRRVAAIALFLIVAIISGFAPSAGAQVLISGTDLSSSITGSVSDGSASLPYRLFQPTGVPTGQKVPLILFLHGMGERGTDNALQTYNLGGLLDHTRSGQFASYILAPQITTAQWFPSNSSQMTEAMKLTLKALHDVIGNPNVDTSRIYVTGLSMGGMGTWDALRREPGTFAAAVPMSGGYETAAAPQIKDIPVWAFHGDADTLVTVQSTRDMIQALRDAGGDPKYTEIAGGGHAIWGPIYDDPNNELYPWLFSQHLAGQTAAGAAPVPAADVTFGVDGPQSPVTLITPVPEPVGLGIIALAGIGLLAKRRRRA